jgi:hypothetical protein
MPVERPHQLLGGSGQRFAFESKGGGGKDSMPTPVPNRRAASTRILSQVKAVAREASRLRDPIMHEGAIPMTVRSTTGWGVTASVPAPRRNDVLSALGYEREARLNVSFDPATLDKFETAAGSYVSHREGRKPAYFNFFESQPQIGLTTVEDLWASRTPLPQPDEEFWWEAWIQSATEARFRGALEELGIANPPRALEFAGIRVVGLVATRSQFDRITRSASIAQLRPASSLNAGLLNMPSQAQVAAVAAAARRVSPAPAEAPSVCLLDTGVRRSHPLLRTSVRMAEAVGGKYTADDYDGHGTKMAGIALFADLPALLRGGSVAMTHGIESVSVRPPAGSAIRNELPAEHVRQAVDLVEKARPGARTYCLALNATDETDDGSPSSLSTEIDALAAEVAQRRLFCVAAGNLGGPPVHGDYQAANDTTPILSPAQAWNALTVAACTELSVVPATHLPIAPDGDLSPWSRTSVNWERRHRPPSKPDVVFEGGNQMIDRVSDDVSHHPSLCLLTTSAEKGAPLTLTGQTSAATAAVAGMCAQLQAEYGRFWPETVRGMVVHSSDHTPAMRARANGVAARLGVTRQQAILERFGYGRPDRFHLLQNAADCLTVVVQGNLNPLRLNKKENGAVLGYMRLHKMPWPIEVLEDLDSVDAELRVTLSYFIQPKLGAAVSSDVDMYASHGLDFDVIRPDEGTEQAIGRINAAALPARKSTAPALDWEFGRYRGRGSVKHDRLPTTAGALARMPGIMVFPRKGWWGEGMDKVEEEVRYSLIASIRTPGAQVYTSIPTAITV